MAKIENGKKRHQFVSFPLEASQLSLNALSSAASELWADPDSATTSIFHSRMLHWTDLNLSQVRKAPQLLVFCSLLGLSFVGKVTKMIRADKNSHFNARLIWKLATLVR